MDNTLKDVLNHHILQRISRPNQMFFMYFPPKMKHFAKRIEFLGQSDYVHDLQFTIRSQIEISAKKISPSLADYFPNFLVSFI